jgi:hypothetical protein
VIITCTRASTLASALDDKSGLIYSGYFQATALRTLAQHRPSQARLALVNSDDWHDYVPLHQDLEAIGGKREANEGTNIHAVVQALAQGHDVSAVPEPTRSDGLAVWAYIHEQGWRVVESEAFVANMAHAEPLAGTLDLMLAKGDHHFVGDIKTVGKASEGSKKALAWSIQTAIYAGGQPYDGEVVRDRWGRPLVETDLITGWPFQVLQDTAVVLEVVRGKALVRPVWLDLAKGRHYADIACNIRTLRKNAAPTKEAPAWA